jgi:excisionase family DNA binding protein
MATVQIMDFVSVNKAAEMLGCTVGRVRQLILDGTLPGEKLNERAWAIPRKAVEKFASRPQVKGRPRVRTNRKKLG